jgi:HEAT repeat protein
MGEDAVMDVTPETLSDTSKQEQLPSHYMERSQAERRQLVSSLAYRHKGPPTLLNAIKTTFSGGDPNVVSALTMVLDLDTDVTVRRTALRGLTRSEDPAAIPGLLRGLRFDDHACRFHAIHGLQQLRAREAVPELIGFLNDRRLRKKVAEALVAIRDERGLEPLRVAASHGWPRSRKKLADAVRQLEAALGY